MNNVEFCHGCLDDFNRSELTDDGYCESCQYEFDAKQDNKTDKDHD